MLTLLIPFRQNLINLAVLLSTLQPQLSQDDDISIIDSSPDKRAVKLAIMYGTTRSYIFVEPTKYSNALEYGIQSMVDNDQKALLFLNENCFVSSTFVANMKKSIGSSFGLISPRVFKNPYYKMDTNFKFYNPTAPSLKEADDFNASCFLMNRNSSPKSYATLENEYVVVLKPKVF